MAAKQENYNLMLLEKKIFEFTFRFGITSWLVDFFPTLRLKAVAKSINKQILIIIVPARQNEH
jgi:hypothetical protein